MQTQELTKRMETRTKSLIALIDALLPGFCEGENCDETCPFFMARLPANQEICSWQRAYESVYLMKVALQKYGSLPASSKPTEFTEPEPVMEIPDPDELEISLS